MNLLGEEEENDGETKKFLCQKCELSFKTLVDLGFHLNSIHGRINGRYICPNCDKTHPTSTKLRIHIETVHLKRKIKCDICDSHVAFYGLRNHLRVAHSGDRVNKPYKCHICDFSSHADKYLKAHILNCHQKEKHIHECDKCDKKFAYPHLLHEHIEAVHEGIKRFILCEICGKSFPKRLKALFDDHVTKCDKVVTSNCDKNKNDKIIQCSACDMTFNATCNYIQHYKYIHGSTPTTHNNGLKSICDRCGKFFPRSKKIQFDEHMSQNLCHDMSQNQTTNVMTVTTPSIKCDICDETFTAYQYYVQHYRYIHGTLPSNISEKPQFVCSKCPNIYFSKLSLRFHIRTIHEGKIIPKKITRERKCPHCDKTFLRVASYQEHIKSKHENTTPFKCDQCNRSFGTRTRFKTHKTNVHSRVKCEECNIEICNPFMLKRHKATIHGIQPTNVFHCDFCPLFFNLIKAKEKHVQKHHNSTIIS